MGEFTEVIRQYKRMCKLPSDCGSDCPLYKEHGIFTCGRFAMREPEKFEAIIMKWGEEHPERTYLSALQEHFPESDIETVIGQACPGFLAKGWPTPPLDCIRDDEDIQLCEKCWNRPVPED